MAAVAFGAARYLNNIPTGRCILERKHLTVTPLLCRSSAFLVLQSTNTPEARDSTRLAKGLQAQLLTIVDCGEAIQQGHMLHWSCQSLEQVSIALQELR
jgi:hypothetical protein